MRRASAILLTAALLGAPVQAEDAAMQRNHPYVGMWVTDDGHGHLPS